MCHPQQLGRIHVAAFRDDALHAEVGAKAVFWTQNNFYGVDVSPLYTAAVDSYFSQVRLLAAGAVSDMQLMKPGAAYMLLSIASCSVSCRVPMLKRVQLANVQMSEPGPHAQQVKTKCPRFAQTLHILHNTQHMISISDHLAGCGGCI